MMALMASARCSTTIWCPVRMESICPDTPLVLLGAISLGKSEEVALAYIPLSGFATECM